MGKGLFVLGTDTDVGKTFVSAGITYILRKNGFNACSYKGIQSGGIYREQELIAGDVQFVKDVTGIEEPYGVMNSYCLKAEVSPHIAAEMEGVVIDKDKLLSDYKRLEGKYDYVVAEGAGGLVVPIVRDRYYVYDFVKDLGIPVVLAARAGVGTINHTALTVAFARAKGIDIRAVVINGYQGNYYEDDNIEVIKSITGLGVAAVLHKVSCKPDVNFIECAKHEYESSIKLEALLQLFE